ncbi:MAG TPA: helix-turn-helix domain-containing protein, partial [Rhizomicrobium sp.]
MDAAQLLRTPAKPDRDERREAILKVAHTAFLSDGYAATSMSAIAAKVGGSKATLYYYFPSKEELFLAVIDEKCRDAHAT